MNRRDVGAVLVFVVLLALVFSALAHGLLLAARAELRTAHSGAELASRRALADGGLWAAMTEGHGPWMDSVAVGSDRVTVDTARHGSVVTTRWRPLSAEAWLVEATARSPAGRASTSSRLAWSLDPDERVDALAATVSVVPGAPVSMLGSVGPTRGNSVGQAVSADLGLLTFDDILALTTPVMTRGTPQPTSHAGSCNVRDPWNWGDPDRPLAPCSRHVALAGSNASLVVDGGAGRVLLVVDGAVVLERGVRLQGLILTTGRLRLRGGSRFEGLAVALGGLDVDGTSLIASSPSRALEVLRSHRAQTGRLIALHAARRLGPG